MTSDSGLFWSMNCDSCEEPKNSFTAAATGLALISSCGVRPSASAIVRRSLHRALDAHQADAEHVLGHFADRTHATVAEVVDVVDRAVDRCGSRSARLSTSRMSEVSPSSSTRRFESSSLRSPKYLASYSTPAPMIFLAADAAVELHAADGRQVVALEGEEQVVEQVLRGILGRRLARTHHAVDLDQRFELRLGRIDAQRVRRCTAPRSRSLTHSVPICVDAGLAERRQMVVGRARRSPWPAFRRSSCRRRRATGCGRRGIRRGTSSASTLGLLRAGARGAR